MYSIYNKDMGVKQLGYGDHTTKRIISIYD